MIERFELRTRALEDTAQTWEVLAEVLESSAAQVRDATGEASGAEGGTPWGTAAHDFWSTVLTGVEEARTLAQEWAEDLRALVVDATRVEAMVAARLLDALRRNR